MADEGFKRKLTAVLGADFKYDSRFMPEEESMSRILTPFSTSKIDIGRQYRLSEFYGTTGCDDRKYLINSGLNS